MKTYLYNDVKLLALEVVEEAGDDFVYVAPEGAPACLYVHRETGEDGETVQVAACIIARMLFNAGESLDRLESINYYANPSIGSAYTSLALRFSDKAVDWMDKIQYQQDSESPWGEAIMVDVDHSMYDRYEMRIPREIFWGISDV